MPTHIHISDVRQFLSCRIKWNFSSALRLGLSPKTAPKAMWKGTLVHLALEKWYESNKKRHIEDCWIDTWEEELERLELVGAEYAPESLVDLQDTCVGILMTYANWAKTHDVEEVVTTEVDFVVPLLRTKDIHFAGRYDLVVSDEDGGIWINDFKVTGGDFDGFSTYLRDQDMQARAYCWAGKKLFGDAFKGIIFTLIRSKAPTQPALLKSGKISANKAVDTTVAVFTDSLLRNGQSPKDEAYVDVYDALRTKERNNTWVRRIYLTFPDYALHLFEVQMLAMAEEMTKSNVMLTPANYFVCRGCPFATPCAALLNVGEDVSNELLQAGYVRSAYVQSAINLLETHDDD